jgi:hypothetical protein
VNELLAGQLGPDLPAQCHAAHETSRPGPGAPTAWRACSRGRRSRGAGRQRVGGLGSAGGHAGPRAAGWRGSPFAGIAMDELLAGQWLSASRCGHPPRRYG